MEPSEIRIKLRFKLTDGLIYNIEYENDQPRLYILDAFAADVFRQAYNCEYYGKFHRVYDKIARSVYLKGLSKHLRKYIAHCLDCAVN